MNTVARRHTLFGLVMALLGMALGIAMAATHDHTLRVAHAHILLLGLVVSLLYGAVYRLWLPDGPSRLATAQQWLHQVGTVALSGGLVALYGGLAPAPALEPLLALSSLAVLAGTVLMGVIFVRGTRSSAATRPARPSGQAGPQAAPTAGAVRGAGRP